MKPTEGLLGAVVRAFTLDAVAVALVCSGALGWSILGLALHICAASFTRRAAALRAPLSRAELDLVTLLALGLPLVGPLTAWCVPRTAENGQTGDAHEAFEAERARQRGASGVGETRELQLSGEPERDLRARLDVESHLDVLRFGDRMLRSNLVRKLAERGGPQDLALLRRVLEDPEEELRIQAFLSLRDARTVHVRRLEELRVQAAATGAVEAWVAVARAHLLFAESGALDPALVRFELERGLEAIQEGRMALATCGATEPSGARTLGCAPAAADARGGRSTGPRASTPSVPAVVELGTLELRMFGRLGRVAEAAEAVAELGTPESLAETAPAVLETWADVALRAGRVGAARRAADALDAAGAVLPTWLASLPREVQRVV